MGLLAITNDDQHSAIVERMEALLELEGDAAAAELAKLCMLAEQYETRNLVAAADAPHRQTGRMQ